MRFSISMLKEALQFNQEYSLNQISDTITSVGLEVEEIHSPASKYKNFIIAEIIECEKHPESSKLNLCKVNTGKEILSVVCGASNARKGIKIVFAQLGAIVPENGMEIKKTAIRGAESNGMICSASELSLDPSKFTPQEGIIEVSLEAKIGMNFSDFANLNDDIFHIAITPNRGDACSILGIARDLSSKGLGSTINLLNASTTEFSELKTIKISEEIKPLLGQVNFAKFSFLPASSSLKKDLKIYANIWGGIGIEAVDLTNYLMFLFGTPMHVYDASKIRGEILIRRSLSGEKFVPIKGDEILLPEGLFVVCDDDKILSLLGVMGDARSKVLSETKEIMLEAIHCIPEEIIKSSRATGLKSDSSYRFERGVDFAIQKQVAFAFLNKIAAQNIEFFSFTNNFKRKQIDFPFSFYEKIIGTKIEGAEVKKILLSLGFEIIFETSEHISLLVPSFRSDISIVQDIAEEIARISGYEKIIPKEIKTLKPVENYDLNFEIKKVLSEEMQEIITYSFFKEKYFGMFSENKNKIKVLNPITQELSTMRDTLIPNLLENVAFSESRSHGSSQIFEVGTIFESPLEAGQKTNIAGVFSGICKSKTFLQAEEKFNIWHAKNKMLEVLFKNFGISENSLKFEALQNQNFHTEQSFKVLLGKTVVAILAAIHPITLDSFEIKEKVFCFEIYCQLLPTKKTKPRVYKENLLPEINREIAVILPIEVSFEKISSTIKALKLQHLKEIFVKDVFIDEERIGKNLKSVSLQFVIKQELQTLTKEIIDGEIIESISQALFKTFGAKLRDGETAK